MWTWVPTLQLLAAQMPCPCNPWCDSSCYHLISLTPSPFSCGRHRHMACMSYSPQLQLLILRPPNTRAHRRESPSPRKSLKWSLMRRQDRLCWLRCRAQPRKHTNQQSVYKPPVPFVIFFSFPIFGFSPKHLLWKCKMLSPYIPCVPCHLGSNLPQSEGGLESCSWWPLRWVSDLDMGLMALLWQAWERLKQVVSLYYFVCVCEDELFLI